MAVPNNSAAEQIIRAYLAEEFQVQMLSNVWTIGFAIDVTRRLR